MALEAYSARRPALPYRGHFAALLLLVVSTGLALALTRARTARVLTDEVRPPGWDIAFRVPVGFERQSHEALPDAAAYRFRRNTGDRPRLELTVWRLEVDARASPQDVAERILEGTDTLWLRALLGQSPSASERELGGQSAVELVDPSLSTVVRAVALRGGPAYAVALQVQGGALDNEAYHLFDLTCRSVEFATVSGRDR